MNIHVKSALIILITLIIGMVIGALVGGAVRRHYIDRFLALREPNPFVAFHESMIAPTETQRDTVRKILLRNHQRFLEVTQRHLTQVSSLMDSMYQELAPVLTEEQREHLKGGMARRRMQRLPGIPAMEPMPGPPLPMMGGPRVKDRVHELKVRLNLTEEQAAQVENILTEVYEPSKEGREPYPLTPQELFERREKRMKEVDKKIEALLTPEQKKKYEKYQEERRRNLRERVLK
ncbi:MAG: hypothetical protein ONB05_06770 [candidate division KSB1 bacterium]|nr:hypothetical protein [candidate division KSB1 bacterium]